MNSFHQSDAESEFEFEARLSQEMQRVSAPDGFADRVMHRVETQAAQQRKGRLIAMPRRSAWMAVAAMLLVGILISSWQWHQQKVRREREQAQQIQRQFDLAMQVTQRTLAVVQERIGHVGEVQLQKSERQ